MKALPENEHKKEAVYTKISKEITFKGEVALTCDKPHMREIIDCFCMCRVCDYQVIKTCLEYKLIIKGNFCAKLHYCSTCVCGAVMSENFEIPFSEAISLGHEAYKICSLDIEVPFCDLDLVGCDQISYFAILCIRIKGKKRNDFTNEQEEECQMNQMIMSEAVSVINKKEKKIDEITDDKTDSKPWRRYERERRSKYEEENESERRKKKIEKLDEERERSNKRQKQADMGLILKRWGRSYERL